EAGDYPASIDWGDGSMSVGTISGAGTFTVSGSHTYVEEGAYPITVTIGHDTAPDAITYSTATVSDPPVIATGGFTVTAVEGAGSGSQTVATFTDPGGAEVMGDYSASINWGDSSTSSGTISLSGGVFTVTGSHTYAEEGTKTITVTLSHDGTRRATGRETVPGRAP